MSFPPALKRSCSRTKLGLCLLIALALAGRAKSIPELSLTIQKIAYDYPVVTLKIQYPTDTEWLELHKNQDTLTLPIKASQKGELTTSVWLSALTTKIYVEAFSFEGDSIARSRSKLIQAEDYQPSQPVLNPSLSEPSVKFLPLQGYVDVRASEILVKIEKKVVYSRLTEGKETFLLSGLHLPNGAYDLELIARNGWGESSPVLLNALSRGDQRLATTFILINKDAFLLTYVKAGKLKYKFPIAIGTPRTPTLPGFWTIEKKQPMSNIHTGWGVLRLLLFRPLRKHHWSGYAIHGTNNPTSIGKEASHGCVRLFNEDVLKLSQEVVLGTAVFVR